MMPFGSECWLHVKNTQRVDNGILKNCTVANIAIKAFLRV